MNLVYKLLAKYNTRFRKYKKYERELKYWKRELVHLLNWWKGEDSWWGVPKLDGNKQKKFVTANFATSPITHAIANLNSIRPHYFEHLSLDYNATIGKKVLEVGCGPMPGILQFAGCMRYGLDPLTDEYIKIGWPLYELGMQFINAYGESIPEEDNFFDAIISVNALDHVDDFEQVVKEMIRVLKPNGELYLEIEYHKPQPCEPQELNDERVIKAFSGCSMMKMMERTKKQLFQDIEKRFYLEKILPDTAFGDERVVLWWGKKNE